MTATSSSTVFSPGNASFIFLHFLCACPLQGLSPRASRVFSEAFPSALQLSLVKIICCQFILFYVNESQMALQLIFIVITDGEVSWGAPLLMPPSLSSQKICFDLCSFPMPMYGGWSHGTILCQLLFTLHLCYFKSGMEFYELKGYIINFTK